MDLPLSTAFSAGYERLAAWADLLDQINVYPVADADTGRNLMISLAPLRQMENDHQTTANQLLMAATGNSGNIANCFFPNSSQPFPMKPFNQPPNRAGSVPGRPWSIPSRAPCFPCWIP